MTGPDVLDPLIELAHAVAEPAKHLVSTPVLFVSVVVVAAILLLLPSKAQRKPEEAKARPRSRSNSFCVNERVEDAETCWAQSFGKLKHCGLRPEPFDLDSRKPSYSQVPLELPLPTLTREEEKCLEELTGKLADFHMTRRTDPSTLIRFLRARKFNVKRAEAYFREAVAYQDKHNVLQALTNWNLEAYEDALAPWWLSGGLFGHGLQGQVVAYERIGLCCWPKVLEKLGFEDCRKIDIVHCMRSLAALEEDSMRRDVPMGSGILVQDCYGFGWDQCTIAAARSFSKIVHNRNMIMPECISTILVIRAPAAWVRAWGLFKTFLDPHTVAKVKVAGTAGTESLALLRQYIANDQIPGYLGGGKLLDDDPECRMVLAPGGPIPPEAIARFRQKLAQGTRKPVTIFDDDDFRESRRREKVKWWYECCI